MAAYQPGDYIKVEFKEEASPLANGCGCVRVESCDERKRIVHGTLDNKPVADTTGELRVGSRLAISFDNIQEHRKPWEFTRQ